MAFPQRIGPTVLTDANATLFTANRDLILVALILVNTNSSERSVTISLVPSGSSAAQGNRIASELGVLANDVKRIPYYLPMQSGDTLQGLCSVSGAVNVVGVYGDEKKVFENV